jgi:hypothetical protein
MVRRVQIEPHHIADFFNETDRWIA